MLMLAGCEKPKWDYFNTDITIDIRDSNGWSWFDSRRPGGNMRNNDVEIFYDGAYYDLVFLDPNTRATERDLPEWDEDGRDPFRLKGYFETETSKIRLLFGEFSVDTKNYRGESFTIDWGDGTSSVVKFDLYASSNGRKKQPTIHEAIWVESGVGADDENARTEGSLFLPIVKD